MITGHHRRQFLDRGFCVLPSVLDTHDLRLLGNTVDALLAEDERDDLSHREHDIGRGEDRRFLSLRHEEFPDLEAFLLGPLIGGIAAALLGGQPHLFVEQFVVKGPNTGAAFAWHQDSGYVGFPHRPYLTIWIAIDDATVTNGCIHVLPRPLDQNTEIAQHRWDEGNRERVGYDGDERGEVVECEAGTIIAFSSMTMHRSGPNITARPRRAYICQYAVEPIIDPETGQQKHFAKPVPPPSWSDLAEASRSGAHP